MAFCMVSRQPCVKPCSCCQSLGRWQPFDTDIGVTAMLASTAPGACNHCSSAAAPAAAAYGSSSVSASQLASEVPSACVLRHMYLLLLQRCKYPALTVYTKVLAACHQQVSTRVTGILADHVHQPVITLQQHLGHACGGKQGHT